MCALNGTPRSSMCMSLFSRMLAVRPAAPVRVTGVQLRPCTLECEAGLAIFVVVVDRRKVWKQLGHAVPDSREIDPQALRDGIV